MNFPVISGHTYRPFVELYVSIADSWGGDGRRPWAKARTAYRYSVRGDDKTPAENMISGALGKLLAVAENYPEFKTNQEFQHVHERISTIEETIANRREFSNDAVNLNNIRIAQVPDL